jgi:hypothetical protein
VTIAKENSWVTIQMPPELKLGTSGIAENARWRVKDRADGTVNVTLEENYFKAHPRLVELLPLVQRDGARGAGWDRLPTWDNEESGLDQDFIRSAIQSRLDAGTHAGFWSAWQLMITAVPDNTLRVQLQEFHKHAIEQGTGASLWLVDVSQTALSRLTALRGLFAAAHAPEVLHRAPKDFEGFLSARGLADPIGVGISALVSTFCVWPAPWLFGVAGRRRASSIVTMCGQVWDGTQAPAPAEMLQLFRSDLLVKSASMGTPRPEVDPAFAVSALSWWVQQCNQLIFMLLDPARFKSIDDRYDPAAHLATVLSVERLVASVLSSLLSDPRGTYVRRILLFDVLELLEGMGQGSYDQLCDFKVQAKALESLRINLPESVADLLLPRCERAVAALEAVGDGFLQERKSESSVEVRDKSGVPQERPLQGAIAAYLRGVRNSTHSFRRSARDPRSLSLLAGHSGDIPEAVSDLAALHLLRVLSDPRRLFHRPEKSAPAQV